MENDKQKKGDHQYGFETRTIHAGSQPDPITGARNTPIYQSTSYVFDDVDHDADLFNLQTFGFIYSRLTNPTISVLEEAKLLKLSKESLDDLMDEYPALFEDLQRSAADRTG